MNLNTINFIYYTISTIFAAFLLSIWCHYVDSFFLLRLRYFFYVWSYIYLSHTIDTNDTFPGIVIHSSVAFVSFLLLKSLDKFLSISLAQKPLTVKLSSNFFFLYVELLFFSYKPFFYHSIYKRTYLHLKSFSKFSSSSYFSTFINFRIKNKTRKIPLFSVFQSRVCRIPTHVLGHVKLTFSLTLISSYLQKNMARVFSLRFLSAIKFKTSCSAIIFRYLFINLF